jgi:hypothetical protein
MLQNLLIIAVLGMAVGTCATTTSKGKPFRALRKWLYFNKRDWVAEWGYGLLRCPFCSSHWYSLIAVGVFRPFISDMFYPADFLLVWLAVTGLASLWSGAIFHTYDFLPDPWEEKKQAEEDMTEVERLGELLQAEYTKNRMMRENMNRLGEKLTKSESARITAESKEWMF